MVFGGDYENESPEKLASEGKLIQKGKRRLIQLL
jgi:hypothetical protein